jgi:hypothetical protein
MASVVLAAASVDASAVRCRERVARESARYAQTVMKALSGCEEFLIKGKIAGPCPDGTAVARIAKAESQFQARVAKSCGGGDRTCGGLDDTTLASYEWDVGTCPDIENAGCVNTVDDCDGVTVCLECVGDVAVEQLVGLYADEFTSTAPGTDVNTCQVRIAKEVQRLFRSRSKVLHRCWQSVSRERIPGPCPDPGDGKTVIKLAKAESKLSKNVCAVCGGADRDCGTADDLSIASVGFAAACPDVTPAEGPSCGGAITTLQDAVDCIGCVARFKTDCLDTLAVPWGASYPASCNS